MARPEWVRAFFTPEEHCLVTLALLWLALAGGAAAILLFSRLLVSSADVIADRTGLGRSFVGVIMLATATSLPELVTGVSSILLVDQPDLAAGDAFGSNLVNLVIIGIIDLLWRNGPILVAVGRAPIVVGSLGIAVVGCTIVALLAHSGGAFAESWPVSPVSLMLFLVFLVGMFIIYRQEDSPQEESSQGTDDTLSGAFGKYTVAMLVIVGAAVLLAWTGDRIAHEMGWEASFVGTQFLAISTSLPEFAASYAAVRIGAPDLAIANLLGSNLFNMGFVLVIDDVAYVDGPLWSGIAGIHLLTAAFAIVMTVVVLAGLLAHKRQKREGRFTWESLALIVLYAAASVLVFTLA